jgi:two-component system NarL family sensor kinase
VKSIVETHPTLPGLALKLAEVQARLDEAEETLRAIRSGEVDAVVVESKRGPKLITLGGAEDAYRMLIESMNEGALTLTADKMILYANQRFAGMVKLPLAQVMGSSFRRFLSNDDRATLRPLMKLSGKTGKKFLALLNAGDGTSMPVQISIRSIAGTVANQTVICMLVTDLTEVRKTEGLLRALNNRVVQVQEAERGRVAFELHDNITQLLCAVIFRSQALADRLTTRDGTSKKEAIKLREMLGRTAEEVERITHDLGPSLLDHLGLVAVLGDARTEFADRTGVSVKLSCTQLTARLPADAELALYRILQESLRNVEKHARARNVSVRLSQQGAFVQLAISDDGVGFDQGNRSGKRTEKGNLGLLSMRERATYVGGALKIRSGLRSGTKIVVLIPSASPSKVRAWKSGKLLGMKAGSA